MISRERSRSCVLLAGLLAIASFYFAVVLIESGNVGVRKTLGKVNPNEDPPGLYFKLPAFTEDTKFVGKEIAIDLTDLTPKAADIPKQWCPCNDRPTTSKPLKTVANMPIFPQGSFTNRQVKPAHWTAVDNRNWRCAKILAMSDQGMPAP